MLRRLGARVAVLAAGLALVFALGTGLAAAGSVDAAAPDAAVTSVLGEGAEHRAPVADVPVYASGLTRSLASQRLGLVAVVLVLTLVAAPVGAAWGGRSGSLTGRPLDEHRLGTRRRGPPLPA